MIDALYKAQMDRFWDRTGALLVRAGVTPNAVTLAALALAVANSAAFLWHENGVAFGLLLAAIECLDNVDGAVARAGGGGSRAGAFLDTVTDRYKDLLPLFAIALVTGSWALCFAAGSGALLVSYGQARAEASGLRAAQLEGGLPDLFERFERVFLLCLGLVFSPLFSADLLFGRDLLFWVLCALALLCHATALQRFRRVWRALATPARL